MSGMTEDELAMAHELDDMIQERRILDEALDRISDVLRDAKISKDEHISDGMVLDLIYDIMEWLDKQRMKS